MSELKEGVAVVTVGRTAPIPPGPQLASKSLPVVIASDQEAVPVEVQNQQISEVSLSLLGIPRAEVALGIFADVTTYDINPNEWASEGAGTTTHIPTESAAEVSLGTGSTNAYQILGSKRFFRYQPGRVSAATFGTRVNTTTDRTDIKKFGAFDKRDGYYLEVQGGGQTAIGDKEFNLYAVRRTSAMESNETGIRTPNTSDGDRGTAGTDLVIVRAGLTYIHAALFDLSLQKAWGIALVEMLLPMVRQQWLQPLSRCLMPIAIPTNIACHVSSLAMTVWMLKLALSIILIARLDVIVSR
jgi:hypothetical protein